MPVQIDLTLHKTARSVHHGGRRASWLPLVSALIELTGRQAELVRHSERSWASATFSGSRHTVVLSFTGAEAVAAGERYMNMLPEHEFAIARHLVADAAVVAVEHYALAEPRLEVTAELLLLEDDG